jgi:hypothetical protein
MPLSRLSVEGGLEGKGFRRSNGDHRFLIYYSRDGKKTSVCTMTSHGSGYRDISDVLIGKMARQCKVTARDFRGLVECSLSQDDYEGKLREQELVDRPAPTPTGEQPQQPHASQGKKRRRKRG